jgi:SAM-dependent methyltransferase
MVYGKEFAKVYDEEWTTWGAHMLPFVLRLAKEHCPNAATWLDLCCGTGALLSYVTKRGFAGVGVDISPHQIKIAKYRAPKAHFYVDDVRDLNLSKKFDVITCTYDSLNYITKKRDLEKAFRKAGLHLDDGGIFIFDMNTFEGLQEKWRDTYIMREPSKTVIIEASFNQKRSIGKCLITGFIKEGRLYRKFEEMHIERGYSRKEIEQSLTKRGFSFKAFDGDTFKKPTAQSGRLVYACQRKSLYSILS